ncbi:unnamed protein product [Victoria cruziana]
MAVEPSPFVLRLPAQRYASMIHPLLHFNDPSPSAASSSLPSPSQELAGLISETIAKVKEQDTEGDRGMKP